MSAFKRSKSTLGLLLACLEMLYKSKEKKKRRKNSGGFVDGVSSHRKPQYPGKLQILVNKCKLSKGQACVIKCKFCIIMCFGHSVLKMLTGYFGCWSLY